MNEWSQLHEIKTKSKFDFLVTCLNVLALWIKRCPITYN